MGSGSLGLLISCTEQSLFYNNVHDKLYSFIVKFSHFAGGVFYLLQEVVDQFGRFPQRNKVLGRENTPEEEDWLNNMPDRFKW